MLAFTSLCILAYEDILPQSHGLGASWALWVNYENPPRLPPGRPQVAPAQGRPRRTPGRPALPGREWPRPGRVFRCFSSFPDSRRDKTRPGCSHNAPALSAAWGRPRRFWRAFGAFLARRGRRRENFEHVHNFLSIGAFWARSGRSWGGLGKS